MTRRPPRRSVNAGLIAATTTVLGAFPVAALCGLFYRLPIPMAGYLSGWDAVRATPLALFFYGVLLGGFLVIGLTAMLLATAYAGFRPRNDEVEDDGVTIGLAAGFVVDAVAIALLANWDRIYGPW